MNPKFSSSKIAKLISLTVAGMLLLLPFHALFTTWAGSNFNHLDLIRIWKELVLVGVLTFSLWLAWQYPELKKWLLSSWIVRLFGLYVLLHIVLGLWALYNNDVNRVALIYALLINLRFILFFIVCFIAAASFGFLKKNIQPILLVPAAVVVAFGLLQVLILPYDFLKHFGYGPETIPAYQTVDANLDYQRIQSTLRGANPLGAYLVLVILVMYAFIRKSKPLFIFGMAAALLAMFYTYSRSAWMGLILAAISYILLAKGLKLKWLALAICSLLVIGAGIFYLRTSPALDDTLLHSRPDSPSAQSSNEVRLQALRSGAEDVVQQPLGGGPGTAGPASFRNDRPARISENYYLQIGQEVGVLGMAIFIAINILAALQLWAKRQEPLAAVLLASLVGISFINLLSHAWTDDTLSYIWWGAAGIALAPAILKVRYKQNEKTNKTSS